MSNLRICLFNPIAVPTYPPLNLTYLPSYLRKYGNYSYKIKLVDINFTDDPIKEIIDFEPHILGFTTLSFDIIEKYEMSRKIRHLNKHILQVCGGVHATINPSEILEMSSVDIVVIGEGEITFKELVDHYIENGKKIDTNYLSMIDGIAYMVDGHVKVNRPRKLIADLDSIPPPDRELLDKHYFKRYYVIRGMNTYGVYTLHGSRGCPYRCIFCCANSTFKGRVRFHSPEYIVDEVDILVAKYKAKWIYFTDDTFFINKEYTEKLCNLLIDKGLNKKINWEVQIRSNLIREQDFNSLKLMRKAGCRQIDIGFESGNQRMLTFIKGPGITIDDHIRAINIINKAGINIMGTFILGTPSETFEEMMDTRQFIKDNYKNIHRFQVGCMIPYPGTKVYELAVKRGIIEDNYLELLRREKNTKSEHGAVVYCDTIAKEDVLRVRMELDNLSLKKVSIFEKAKWLLYNAIHNPKIAINGYRWTVVRFYKYALLKARQ